MGSVSRATGGGGRRCANAGSRWRARGRRCCRGAARPSGRTGHAAPFGQRGRPGAVPRSGRLPADAGAGRRTGKDRRRLECGRRRTGGAPDDGGKNRMAAQSRAQALDQRLHSAHQLFSVGQLAKRDGELHAFAPAPVLARIGIQMTFRARRGPSRAEVKPGQDGVKGPAAHWAQAFGSHGVLGAAAEFARISAMLIRQLSMPSTWNFPAGPHA